MKFRYFPRSEEANGWAAILPERLPSAPLQGVVQGDWVVVGAGYAGLAFAHALADHQPQAHIVLLEAGVVGDNAAGRNSGFAIDLPHNIGSGNAELAKASEELPPPPESVDEPPTLTDRVGLVGRL